MKRLFVFCFVLALAWALSGAPASTTQISGAFSLQMPVKLSDAETNTFGLNPFGAHIGDHGIDGHPGWDIEFRSGAAVLAAAAGTVQFIAVNPQGDKAIQLMHTHNRQNFRTIYWGIDQLADGIAPGMPVSAGQPLGTPLTRTQRIGTEVRTWRFIHFQLDDFSINHGLTNPHAVSPETYLHAEGRAVFDALWKVAAYSHELTEPFPSNSRNVAFPLTRTWLWQSGNLPTRLEFKRARVDSIEYEYAFYDANGAATESGTLQLQARAGQLALIDLKPASGDAMRLGVYDVLNDTLRLELGAAGAPRPTTLTNPTIYKTQVPGAANVSAASFTGVRLAPEMIITAFGSELAVNTQAATGTPLPLALASSRVKVRDSQGVTHDAPLFFVSPAQINYLLPAGVATGTALVQISSGDGPIFGNTVELASVAPGLFTANANGRGVAAAIVLRIRENGAQSYEPVARYAAAQQQFVTVPIDLGAETERVFLILYGTGFRYRSALAAVSAQIGGVATPPLFAGAQADFAGLDQLNLLLPRVLAGRGEVNLVVTVDGQVANPVTIHIK